MEEVLQSIEEISCYQNSTEEEEEEELTFDLS